METHFHTLLLTAAERKGLVRKEQKNFVRNLRVPADATDGDIQNALRRIFQRGQDRDVKTERERQRGRVQFSVQYQTISVQAQF